MSENILCVKNIKKSFGGVHALKGVDLTIKKGETHCLAGENGCGKSMLMRVICGLVIPTHGSVTIDGEQLGKELSFPRSLGMMIEKPGFLGSYTGLQNLEMLAAIRSELKKKEIEDVLARVGLEDVMHKKYRKYSLGMKQKLGIAAAIMEKPDILILDEPANALDEKSEEQLWNIVREEKERGALVIVSCHTAEVLESVADEIYRMDCGRVKEHIVC